MSFKQVDDLASVWCECGELELRHENYDQALRLLRVNTARVWGRVGVYVRCAVWLSRPGKSLSSLPPLPTPHRRPLHCPPDEPSTSMARSLCKTVCTSH